MSDLPKIGKPASRALTEAGFTTLEQLAGVRRREVLGLHGVGKRAVELINDELDLRGLPRMWDD